MARCIVTHVPTVATCVGGQRGRKGGRTLPRPQPLVVCHCTWDATSVLTRATRRHIPEDDILHSHRRECIGERLCGLVVRVPDYGSRGPGFDYWRCQIFCVVVELERGPPSLVRINEELLE
jgi:hypothetical protein